MSPTYTSLSVDCLHPGEHLATAALQRQSQSPCKSNGPFLSRQGTFGHGSNLRSGSLQVLPNLQLQTGSVIGVTEGSFGSNSDLATRPSSRRYPSADLLHPNASPAWAPSPARHELEGTGDQTRTKLSPRPYQPRPLRSSSFRGVELPWGPFSTSSIPQESSSEDPDIDLTREGPATEVRADVVGTHGDGLRQLQEYTESKGAEERSAGAGASAEAKWTAHDTHDGNLTTLLSSSLGSSPVSCRFSSSHSAYSRSSSSVTTNTDVTTSASGREETPTPEDQLCGYHHIPTTERRQHNHAKLDRYGTPEMPRGPAKLPHVPANGLPPRMPSQGHPKHLPRAEKLPMSGYQLLASTISSTGPPAPRNRTEAILAAPSPFRRLPPRHHSSANGSGHLLPAPPEDDWCIKPIYRRFESLHHRLLLHLQDELGELEEQLRRLDTADTQTRRVQSCILPASRRAESMAGGELQSHKMEILSRIASKLGQYNHTLSSFTSTRDLPKPSHTAVSEYRDYLATHQPISDDEIRFLDSANDLVTLEAPIYGRSFRSSSVTGGDLEAPVYDPSSPPSPSSLSSFSSSGTGGGGLSIDDTHNYVISLRLPDDHPARTVTPIPGTMHGNSWLQRHGRLSADSRSQSGTAGPRNSSSRSSSSSETSFTNYARTRPAPDRARLLSAPSPSCRQHRASSVSSLSDDTGGKQQQRGGSPVDTPLHLALATAIAVLLPVMAFAVVPGFVARMIVVMLVGLSVVGSVAQPVGVAEPVSRYARRRWLHSAAVYTGTMAIVAGVMG